MDAVASFRSLHARETVLVLANAWDAASAVLIKSVGAKAIATSSAGVAWSCGFADGNALPRASLLFAVGAICRVSGELPVSVDLEGGYSSDPGAVADLARDLHALGVAGINLEDGAESPEVLAAKISAVKAAADMFINARTDVVLRNLATGADAVREVTERGKRYAQAGADGFFVPALAERAAIGQVARGVRLPLNVLAVAALAPLGELYALGVRRLSAGSSIAKVALSTARRCAQEFLRGDASALFAPGNIEYAEMNALFRKGA